MTDIAAAVVIATLGMPAAGQECRAAMADTHLSIAAPRYYVVAYFLGKKNPIKVAAQEELLPNKQAPTSQARSARRYKWKTGELTSAPFIPPSSSYKLVID